MHRKRVLYIQEGMQTYGRLARLTAELDAEFEVVSADAAARGLPAVDLVVCPTLGMHRDAFADFEQRLRAIENVALLFVVDPDALKTLRLPAHLRADFALSTSTDDELLIRMRHLLWPGEEMANSDFITVDSMVINLSTYQVLVDGSPVDFTYLEYALLAFLVTHSGHVYSRDAALACLGFRLLWRFAHRRRARAACAFQAWQRSCLASSHRPRRRLYVGIGAPEQPILTFTAMLA